MCNFGNFWANEKAAITFALSEKGAKDDNGNEIKPVGIIYESFSDYVKGEKKQDKIGNSLKRLNLKKS